MTTQTERAAAHRLDAAGADDRPRLEWSEADARERDRKAEERTRPVTAELTRNRGTRETVVRMLGESGAVRDTAHVIPLRIPHDVRQDEAEGAAAEALRKAGFRPVPGWTWTEVGADASRRRWRVAIEPTAAYLAYNERRFGPLPTIPETPGVTFRRIRGGRWEATAPDGRTYALTWQPLIEGDQWRVWGGPQHSELIRSTTRPEKALFVLRHPSHVRL